MTQFDVYQSSLAIFESQLTLISTQLAHRKAAEGFQQNDDPLEKLNEQSRETLEETIKLLRLAPSKSEQAWLTKRFFRKGRIERAVILLEDEAEQLSAGGKASGVFGVFAKVREKGLVVINEGELILTSKGLEHLRYYLLDFRRIHFRAYQLVVRYGMDVVLAAGTFVALAVTEMVVVEWLLDWWP